LFYISFPFGQFTGAHGGTEALMPEIYAFIPQLAGQLAAR
jgi:hypothetical protein